MAITEKRLGLDLGTNSIGWGIMNYDKVEDTFELLKNGAVIFSEGVKTEKGIESSKAADRTDKRSARRMKFRRKLRKYETLLVLAKNGNFCPLTVEEVERWRKSNFKDYPLNPDFLIWLRTNDAEGKNPYAMRDAASRGKVDEAIVGRALYHIAQRRGFLSNRLDQSGEGVLEDNCPKILEEIGEFSSTQDISIYLEEYFTELAILDKSEKSGFRKELDEGEKKLQKLYKALVAIVKKDEGDFTVALNRLKEELTKEESLGAVKGNIKGITNKMTAGDFSTVGQYFYSIYDKEKIRGQYTSREEHYKAEFEVICKAQGFLGIDETQKLPERRYSGLVKELYNAIFYQRPLRSQKGLVGNCKLEPQKARCSISHPDFEELRMWNYLNTIKIDSGGERKMRFLTMEEKTSVLPKFYRRKDSFIFDDIAKALIPKKASYGFYKDPDAHEHHYLFNYRSKDTVSGCPIAASLRGLLGTDYKKKKIEYKVQNSQGGVVSKSVDYHDCWHLLYSDNSVDFITEFATEKLKVDEKTALQFARTRIKKDFGELSLNAIRKILTYAEKGLGYSYAVFLANIVNVVDPDFWHNEEIRISIENDIASIIDRYSLDKKIVDIQNGLIKKAIEEGFGFSKEAEKLFVDEFSAALGELLEEWSIEKNEQIDILKSSTDLYVKHLKTLVFVKNKRLDEKILDYLSGHNQDGVVYAKAERLKNMYHPSDIEKFKKVKVNISDNQDIWIMGSPMSNSVKNPMAMRALFKLRSLLNKLIINGDVDENTTVHIEMARELNDANRRAGIKDFNNYNKDLKDKAIVEIKELYLECTKKAIEPTEDDILRYRLWNEQNRKEIYEPSINGGASKNICISQIIGANPDYDIEHTIPRSLSQDNSLMNKTLCSKEFNRQVKKQKIPTELVNHEIIMRFVGHWFAQAKSLEQEMITLTSRVRGATTKETKDKNIRKRHLLKLKHAYVMGKYERFVLKEPKQGFKNSQIPDTGIITKFAQSYLRSYFKRVISVKGGMVDEFRKIWGLHESYSKDEKTYYKPKSRDSHTHHTIDAITIACMTKSKYDVLANAWALADQEKITEARKLLEKSKPWPTFTQDLKKLENEILIAHQSKNKLKVQSKKIVRIRGKKQYLAEMQIDTTGKLQPMRDEDGKILFKKDEKGEKIPLYQQGDTVRGSLHKDTYYGAIKTPLSDEIRYVGRKIITKDFSAADVNNIVDKGIKERIEKLGLKNVLTKENTIVLPADEYVKDGKKIVRSEMIIKKIRLFQTSIKNPIRLKEQADLSKSVHEHKNDIYVQNDENFGLAIYESLDAKGAIKRSSEAISNITAATFFNANSKSINEIAPKTNSANAKLKYVLTKGKMVLMYDKTAQELKEMEIHQLYNRLYEITQLDSEGSSIKLLHHSEARKKDELTKAMGLKIGMKGGKNMDNHKEYPWIKLAPNAFDCLVEGFDFKMKIDGQIEFI